METAIQMVCLECDAPLDFSEDWADGELAGIRFEHPVLPGVSYDHAALPALADLTDEPLDVGCDCCGIESPRPEGFVNVWTITPDRPVTLRVGDRTYHYTTPWRVCAACSAAIAEDDLKLLLRRNVEYNPVLETVTPEQREMGLALTRELLLSFLAAQPKLRSAEPTV
ncbi:hypothetical protein GCM10022221_36670 [Actinocorallia aurea]